MLCKKIETADGQCWVEGEWGGVRGWHNFYESLQRELTALTRAHSVLRAPLISHTLN